MRRIACLLVIVPACGSDPEPPPAFDYCPTQHADGDVVVCERAYADHPRVHLPDDTLGADGTAITIYAAFDPLADQPLVLRDGSRLALADAAGLIRPFAELDSGRVDGGLEWPTYEFLETVYEITGTATHVDGGAAAISDATARPIVRLRPDVLDGVMAGAWEGTLSGRTGFNTYDPDVRIPIRVTWTGFESDPQVIPHWMPGDGELTYALIADGTIANATAAVTLADGSCAPSLAALGDGNPIADTTATVSMTRVPAMHVAGDYQLVWNGGMGSLLPVHPAAAIQDAARAEFLVTTSAPHGTPNGMQLLDFHAVTDGGTACTP